MSFTVMLQQLLMGFGKSILIFVLTLLFSIPLALPVAFGRMSKNALLRNLIKIYISVMRGTPLMLQLLFLFYAPYVLAGVSLSQTWRITAVIVGFSINYAAYFAEIYRSGIQSMPVGQYEAARVLGYSKNQTFFLIILPQVVKRILPAVTNEVITLVKDTSLAFALSYMELFSIAKQIVAKESTIMPLVIAAVFYYVFNFVVAYAMERLEKNMAYYR